MGAGVDLGVPGAADLPFVGVSFRINLITGVLFFLSDPVGYGVNPSLPAKAWRALMNVN